MKIKNFLLGLVKKVLKQTKLIDGKEEKISKIALQILTNKAKDYLARGDKKFTIELIMDRFVPRKVRKIIQQLSYIDDRLREVLFEFADKMNDDGLKEEAFVLAMGAAKKVTSSLDKVVDDTINRVKLSQEELQVLKEKIEHQVIKIASDDQPMSDISIDVESLVDNDGFENL